MGEGVGLSLGILSGYRARKGNIIRVWRETVGRKTNYHVDCGAYPCQKCI